MAPRTPFHKNIQRIAKMAISPEIDELQEVIGKLQSMVEVNYIDPEKFDSDLLSNNVIIALKRIGITSHKDFYLRCQTNEGRVYVLDNTPITPDIIIKYLEILRLTLIKGIGVSRAKTLHFNGINTLLKFQDTDIQNLADMLNVTKDEVTEMKSQILSYPKSKLSAEAKVLVPELLSRPLADITSSESKEMPISENTSQPGNRSKKTAAPKKASNKK